jgi:hypothetical protein
MGIVDRKQDLFENVARLRRVGREVPGNPDVTAVRAALERELGATVSRRLAARLLGVSHTALDRWIRTGDLPVVYSREGRVEIPVPALLELYEAIKPEQGRRYVLKPTMERQREAARSLHIADDLKGDDRSATHDRARARNLAYHRAVARRLRRTMVDEARHVLFRWRAEGRIADYYADRWAEILNRPIREIRQTLVGIGPEADDLRQTSPFAGLLSEPERRRILEEVQ